jgi:hypothetical protein
MQPKDVRRFIRDAELQRLRQGGEAGRAFGEFQLPEMQERPDMALRRLQGQTEKVSLHGLRP